MSQISPASLAEDTTLVRVSPQDYDWDAQRRNVPEDSDSNEKWLAASGSTATETMTGNLLDSDSDDDAQYD